MSWGLEHVRVAFGGRVALADVTLRVDPGQVSVLVGGDGAGKTTGLRALVGTVRPGSGVVRRPPKREIGYLPATAGLYTDLTVTENVEFSAAAYGLGHRERDRRADEVVARLGLAGARDRLAGHLSGGMQRKLALGMALLHRPRLLVLDEPTTGVDPVSRSELWRLVAAAAANGTAVAVATTYVNEAARAASVLLLDSGRVLASGTPGEILGRVPGAVGAASDRPAAAHRSWRRGAGWRVWSPGGDLPPGVEPVTVDFDDAVVVAALAAQTTAPDETRTANG